ncbi:uncharacterized protein BDW47DRAFT_100756 [Aspergillus candidus]|uniref:Uncharacterized protein n=1 Tax=Aspergillus candidus TaxID=41067 RepID=A0A2I2FJF3_ASPCN|nr:hypothetical protein BDW47DRAFT_100756 [Aspergillus candidus]PLB40740.1 hypothetical protein BDW47DRAFT_100756 [Aspergillus candidus]
MPTPERRTDRPPSRRNQHDDHQYSPFHLAYRDSDLDDYNASKIPSPPQNYGGTARQRDNFSKTRSLRGAFRVAGDRYSTMAEEDARTFGTPNRYRRQSVNLLSPESNPPNELAEAYRQISDAGDLVDEAPENDFLPDLRGSRSMRSSSGSLTRDNALFLNDADAGFLDDGMDESPRRRSTDHSEDKQRLRRATASQSPVLNRNGIASALTSENLLRREEEDQAALKMEEELEEDYGGVKPSLNLPSNWGTRGRHRSDWLRNITKRSNSESAPAVERRDTSPPKFNLEVESTSPQAPPPAGIRDALREPPSNRYNRLPSSDLHNKAPAGQEENRTGDPIPNTPIMVYKNSTFTKRSPTKRDSQDLLRKLSRNESPGQTRNEFLTPEAQKIQAPERRIYDKTPVVTGAWIDTPVTERPSAPLPDHLSKGVVPSPVPSRTEPARQPTAPVNQMPSTTRSPLKKDRETRVEEKRQEQKNLDERPKNEDQKEKVAKQPLIKPDLPKSALETVMQDFKADKDSLDVGDDTLESLQEMLNDKPSGLKEEEDDAAYQKAVLAKLERPSPSSNEQGTDLDRLNDKLQSLADSLMEVRTGLNSIEKQVSRDADTICSLPPSPTDSGSSTTYVSHLSRWLPRLWTRGPESRRIRPTLLGWGIIFAFVWFFSESTLCDYYCHPLVSDICEGNCLIPDAPQFPYVIPTMLWRWSHLSSLLAPIGTIMVAFYRLATQLLGFSDGYVQDTPASYVNISGEILIHGRRLETLPTGVTNSGGFFAAIPKPWRETQQPSEAVANLNLGQGENGGYVDETVDDGSMEDDEYI